MIHLRNLRNGFSFRGPTALMHMMILFLFGVIRIKLKLANNICHYEISNKECVTTVVDSSYLLDHVNGVQMQIFSLKGDIICDTPFVLATNVAARCGGSWNWWVQDKPQGAWDSTSNPNSSPFRVWVDSPGTYKFAMAYQTPCGSDTVEAEYEYDPNTVVFLADQEYNTCQEFINDTIINLEVTNYPSFEYEWDLMINTLGSQNISLVGNRNKAQLIIKNGTTLLSGFPFPKD